MSDKIKKEHDTSDKHLYIQKCRIEIVSNHLPSIREFFLASWNYNMNARMSIRMQNLKEILKHKRG